ncbi:beta-glucoside-specific PTS transporter subunit IIABC [Clostridium intestinale]|uniref:PTS system, beta-glucosides-specific IIC component n=1 Tax=Clostridium intestinale DSM 6191 TaxID=1121320 RepID=A0A1M5XPZ0_9CLOT|nr:beta-glucoside-specific PTS transporter subunit IIABC [Clostridium intestinale]SHI01907.1 PTS system, beta-glucosides-specific IIC component [Clostridium intestinale DSM 6191]
MTNKEIALKTLKLVGGESNISNVTHCATRLRLVLKDDKKVNLQQLNMVEGVLKAQNSGGQLQVVLGGKVEKVYDEFVKEANITSISLDSISSVKKNPFNTFLETIAGVFTPILPALVGCGMMKCLSSILTASGFVNAQSGFILIFNMIADCVFYFMPFFLAVSAAKKFKTNEYLAIALAACLLHPTILTAASNIATTGVSTINFLGLPILLVKYTSTVIPIILSVWVMSYVYRFIDKFIPEMLKVILVPMLVLLVMVPLTLIAIGPFGSYVGTWLSNIISLLFTANGIIAGFVLGFFRPILVMFGMHYSIMPMQIQQIAEQGYTAMLPSALAANMAQAGAVFAVFVITKNKTMKAAAGSSSITAIFGVTEPAIYGVNLKYKKPFFAGCLAAGIVGGFFGLVNASGTAIAIPGILSLGTYQANSFIFIIIGTVTAFALGAIFTFIARIDEDSIGEVTETKIEVKAQLGEEVIIRSPLKGNLKDIAEVNDKVFSEGIMGKGVAIEPSEGKVIAPFDGKVEALFNTKHAIGLKSDNGVEMLIHIGIDTVNLEGKYFTAYVENGQEIKAGDLLVEFDIDAIKNEGYDIITPVLITNVEEYKNIFPITASNMVENDEIIKVIK